MSTPSARGGASVSAHARIPSVHLAKLAELLARAIPHGADPLGVKGLPLARLDGQRLVLNTRGVLSRLVTLPDFAPAFEPSDNSGFIRDLAMPPIGATAKVGGRLLPGSEPATAKAMSKLYEAIAEELDSTMSGADLRAMALPTLEQALTSLADTASVAVPNLPATASMVPVQFAGQDRKADERTQDIARVLTAVETIDGNDWLESMLTSIRRRLLKRGVNEDDVDAIVDHIRDQRGRPGSQIQRFLDFLEDEALARVRLQVTMRLMATVAEGGSAGLQQYVECVRQCFDLFAGVKGEALPLDVASVYGSASNVDLADELRKAMFYGCLPVWAEHSVQLFETRSQPTEGFATQREVSYRFRVNGTHPESGLSAFQTRVERLREELLEDDAEKRAGRQIAQAFFLYLVTPDARDNPTPFDVKATADALAERVKQDPRGALTFILNELSKRVSVMSELAGEVISVLKNRSKRILEAADRYASTLTVAVSESIVDYDAVISMSSPTADVLVKSAKGASDTIAWFQHLQVSDTPVVQRSALSYTVRISLTERSLSLAGGAREVRMQRDLSTPTLPIRFVPYRVNRETQAWEPALVQHGLFDAPCGIELQYDPRLLQLSSGKDQADKPRREQLRTASCVAFTLLAYITIWHLLTRIKGAFGADKVAATMFRLQLSGKEVDDSDGSAAVYAISQAIEKALAADVPVKLQGLVPTGDAAQMRWRKRGALAALLGGQPLRFEMKGALQRVALVSYVTRPCDKHPALPDADGFLFISRTYHAVHDENGATLQLECMRSRYVDSRKTFATPQLILEEVARLRNAGFPHVMLLSHHFGNRHIGRAADRHSPHGSLAFLDEVAERFPDMRLYTLRRDVFPATRLRTRTAMESGFEVTEYRDHQKMYDGVATELHRGLMPVYTFATLSVVGEESRPQSGFCTYFYDVEQRGVAREEAELARQNILGIGDGKEVRESLISVLQALHFMESEKPAGKSQLLPVLDPFDWATPVSNASAGELAVMTARRKGPVLLCFQAILAHVTKVLHKEAE